MRYQKIASATAVLGLLQLVSSCDLSEKLGGQINTSQVTIDSPTALLQGVYNAQRDPIQGCVSVFALEEVSTDARIMPTRGPDWDDNGKWRALFNHTWDGNNERVRDTFTQLEGIEYAATDLLRFNPTTQQQAEARFIRAWAEYLLLDLYDQVLYRDPGEELSKDARVRKGTDALNFIISELTTIQKDLPDAPVSRATKDAARVLLMKCYLNKGAYANRQTPTFAAADMNQVITLADQIITSGKYSFTPNFFDNFAPNNTAIGLENIFTQANTFGNAGPTRDFWKFVSHYNMVPVNGYNGPATTGEFYALFEPGDKRRGVAYASPGGPANPGNRINVGFLAGQQYNLLTDAPLTTRGGAPLAFTQDINLFERGADLEAKGIRPLKYPVDYASEAKGTNGCENDHVTFRLADVLLMKAEAIMRGGTATSAGIYGSTALAIVNTLRTHPSRGASALPALTLDILLDERGRELYGESWRRQDMIRFGKFLAARKDKPQSDPKYLVYPVPTSQVAINPNITQNPGY
ncbi:RagB/SusD family nutrient uptake outer membrane protein [Hymenobacter negativus]|uniref:RagB/SusD family nutrient uptake outer membrane protein n=1 Tax=Hymenobacter negativus TaxID=2795026 RepID=A0ABS0QBM5_9BACT|nr:MULTISPECIES: RagB/SusD family nutrient uptake outer membrane protein [Bacteria]MBH8559997.1 RagB/SusD family nutrient uptake outer membrane protein [Hymenobacter negativus]MBH8570581.1 RagB/SusD family nutrient uptake outer membrane protein [Hymenobacter negativus]MBR7210319.1 RagB/SusD family nutrient uptake outer membrane protein [Microvirga sp. STS02]